jgi:hypothetical protein
VFNNNGVILAAGGLELSETEMDKYLTKEFVNSDSYKKYKSNWGVFEIDGMLIKFERWYPSDPPLKSYINSGLILNDTTFQITKSMRSDGSEVKEINEIYHFRSFSPKPDSTNSFVR